MLTRKRIGRLLHVGLAVLVGVVAPQVGSAVDPAVKVVDSGDVGIGTETPESSLHVTRSDGSAQILVEESGPSGRRNMFVLRNNGEMTFDLKRSDTGANWQFLNNEFFVINRNDKGSGTEFYLDEAGNGVFEGTVTTGGGVCGGGCDGVFQPGYELESIEEHAAKMWQDSHLRGVGPTPEEGSMNLSQKTAGILNELEKAHIYIERLHERLKDVSAEGSQKDARIADLEQRLSRIETALVSLTDANYER